MMAGMSVGPQVQRDASELGCAGAVTFANPETGNAMPGLPVRRAAAQVPALFPGSGRLGPYGPRSG